MKHVTYGEKAHFMGDDAADTLMEYASALGRSGCTDSVTLRAIDEHGNLVDASFLLNPSTSLLVESSSSDMADPDNEKVIEHMHREIYRLLDPPEIGSEGQTLPGLEDDHHDHSRML